VQHKLILLQEFIKFTGLKVASEVIAACVFPVSGPMGKNLISPNLELPIVITCPSFHAQITYPNY
jgi:hypothetical protein